MWIRQRRLLIIILYSKCWLLWYNVHQKICKPITILIVLQLQSALGTKQELVNNIYIIMLNDYNMNFV